MLEIRDITISYEGSSIITSAHCFFEKGKRYQIIGNSGCGKTSLFYAICGAIMPDSGEIFFNGESVLFDGQSYKDGIKKDIAFIFQEPAFISNLTVAHNMQLIAKCREISSDVILELFKKFGQEKLLQERPGRLSLHQKQLVSVILAICGSPKLVIWDGAFVNVPAEFLSVLNEIFAVLYEQEATFVYLNNYGEELEGIEKTFTLAAGSIS